MWVLLNTATQEYASGASSRSTDLQKARTFKRRGDATNAIYSYTHWTAQAQNKAWVPTEVLLTLTSQVPAPPPTPPPPSEPEDPLEAAGLVFRPGG